MLNLYIFIIKNHNKLIIKGIGEKLEKYKFDNGLSFEDLKGFLGVSIRSVQNIIETDSIPKTEIFIKLFNLLDLSIEEFLKSETMTQINNNHVHQNNGTIQNVLQESRHELELIIEYQKKEITALTDALKQRDIIIELLKNLK